MVPEQYTAKGLQRRGELLMVVAVLALAVVGYAVGVGAGVPAGPEHVGARHASPADLPASSTALPAPDYADVGAGALRASEPGATWAAQTAALRAGPGEPSRDLPTRLASLGVRAERRAFNGAPPRIPHATGALGDRSCLACHGQGLAPGTRPAQDLPHPYLTNCTQCHAPRTPAVFAGRGGLLAASGWRGIAAPREGPRAAPGAPPAVPHTLQMRDNCLACHGPHGWPGMQTTHPERRSCLQCHAPIQDRRHPGRGLPDAGLLPGTGSR